MPYSFCTHVIGTKRLRNVRCRSTRLYAPALRRSSAIVIRCWTACKMCLVCGKSSTTLIVNENKRLIFFVWITAKWRPCRRPHRKAIMSCCTVWSTTIHRRWYSVIAWRHFACSTTFAWAKIILPRAISWCLTWKAFAWAIWHASNWAHCAHSWRTFRRHIQRVWRKSTSCTHRRSSIKLWCWSSHWFNRKCCHCCNSLAADPRSFSTRPFCQRWGTNTMLWTSELDLTICLFLFFLANCRNTTANWTLCRCITRRRENASKVNIATGSLTPLIWRRNQKRSRAAVQARTILSSRPYGRSAHSKLIEILVCAFAAREILINIFLT